jgi:hypothetical protein
MKETKKQVKDHKKKSRAESVKKVLLFCFVFLVSFFDDSFSGTSLAQETSGEEFETIFCAAQKAWR